MKLRHLAERDLISAIRNDFSSRKKGVVFGIGDDAAVLKIGRKFLILTKDLLLEDFHFIRDLHPPFLLGRKSLNVNLSDIAAMGGTPQFALLGLGIPAGTPPRWVSDFFSGFKSAADETGVNLVGGDVSGAAKISISVTILGESTAVVPRSGARPGHLLYVSGCLGDAMAGFLLIKKGHRLGKNTEADSLRRAFLDPVPQIALGKALAGKKLASAMIDTSDGLSVDLLHLCEESGVGAEIYLGMLPLSAGLRKFSRRPLELALHGGEDYQLLFSVPPETPEKTAGLEALEKKYKITHIGRMTRKKGIYTVDAHGKRSVLKIRGYEHFRRSFLK